MKLYICEKPSQARDIAKIVGAFKKYPHHIEGNGIKVTWCLGHLLQLMGPEEYAPDLKPWRLSVLPVIPEKWKLCPNPKTKDQLSGIKALLKEATEVIVATDADREGDVIGREVLDYFKYKGKVSRLWLSALDDASIKKALAELQAGEKTYPLYQSGLGRQRADWVVGMNMTMATTCLYSKGQGTMSVGRVQTPTLNLVVTRDREIENFKPRDYYIVKAGFNTPEKSLFMTLWKPHEDLADEEGRLIKKEHIDALLAKIDLKQGPVAARVTDFKEVKKTTKAPLCFALSSLQKLASSKFGFSAKDTLTIAQSLYERHKATTYPRTDCGYLPESQFKDARPILTQVKAIYPALASIIDKANYAFKSDAWNDKKVTAHHGIIPTMNPNVNIEAMSDGELKLYDLICRYYLAQFLGDYEYLNRNVEVTCKDERFKASSNTPLVAAWKEAIGKAIDETEEDNAEAENRLPALKKGEPVECVSLTPEAKQTRPPARFTEGTLIDAMKNIAKYVDDPEYKKLLKENAGIGTEATRANIIELLLNREYMHRDKKLLISTEKGRQVIDLAPSMLKDPVTTAKWEELLDNIAKGEGMLTDFLALQIKALKGMLSELSMREVEKQASLPASEVQPCPQCTKPLVRREGKYGFYWSCTGYPDCKHTMKDKEGVPIARPFAEVTDIECPQCKQGKLIKRQGTYGFFYGCNQYPTCKTIVKITEKS